MHTRSIIIKGGAGPAAREAQDELLSAVEPHYDQTSCFAIRLAVEEALSNAFKHGNQGDPDKQVRLDFSVDASKVEIEVEDEGSGFDPRHVPDPTEVENLQIPSGRGIVLMRSFMTNVSFNESGNRVRMTFQPSTAQSPK